MPHFQCMADAPFEASSEDYMSDSNMGMPRYRSPSCARGDMIGYLKATLVNGDEESKCSMPVLKVPRINELIKLSQYTKTRNYS